MKTTLPVSVLLWLALVVTPVASGQGNLIEGDSSFETGYGVWNKSGAVDDTTSPDGSRCVELTGRISTAALFALEVDKPYIFSVYLKADQPDTKIQLAADRANWSGSAANRVVVVGTEWSRYSLAIPAQSKGSWRTVWLIVHHPDWLGQPGRTFWLDACQFEQAGEASPYRSAEPVSVACELDCPVAGNLFFPEEPVKIRFNLYNSRLAGVAVSLLYTVKDYYGTLLSQSVPLELAPKANITREISLATVKRKGFHLIEYRLAGLDGATPAKAGSFCVVDRPLPFSADEGSLFALSSIDGGRVPSAARMGVKWSEARFGWAWIEKEKGRLDEGVLAGDERYVDELLRHGINPIGRLGRTPTWAGEYKETSNLALPRKEAIPAYEEFVYRVVSRLKPKVHYWLNWGGEDDLTVKHHAASMKQSEALVMDRFAEMMRGGYRGAKRADAACVYGGGGQPSGVDCSLHFPFSRKMFELAGDSTDFFAIDCYTWPRDFKGGKKVESPEAHRFADVLREALSVAGDKRCWIGEYGFALSPQEKMDSRCARMMADYMVRSFVLTATVPRFEMLQWFACWPCVEGEGSYDIWRWPNPLPVVAAYSALAQVLTGAKNPREIDLGASIKAYGFEKKHSSLAVLWVPSNREVVIDLKDAKGLRVLDIMGNEIAQASAPLKLSGSPLYLLSDAPPDRLAQVVSQARIALEPVAVELALANLRTLRVNLVNQMNARLKGDVAVTVPLRSAGAKQVTGPFSVLKNGTVQAVELRLPAPIDTGALSRHPVEGEVRTDQGVVKVSQAMSLLPCAKFDQEVVVDGNLTEWQGREFIELKDASCLAPPDALSHKLWTGEDDLSAKVYLGWDEKRFYFAAIVRDDLFVNEGNQENIWSGDGIQIAFDPGNDALKLKPAGYEQDDREFSFGFSQKLNQPVICRSWPVPMTAPRTELSIRREGNTLTYELALPFAEIAPLKPEEGKVFGFNFAVLDRDEGRSVDYWLGLAPGICDGKDPSAFRKFNFAASKKK